MRREEKKHEKEDKLELNRYACTALAASLISVPSMAEINQECLFTGEITQNASDSPRRFVLPVSTMARTPVVTQSAAARDPKSNSRRLAISKLCPRGLRCSIAIKS